MIGAVLAGGAGKRMGGAKPGAELGGATLLARAVEAMAAAGLTPLVVAKAGTELPPVEAEVLREPAELPEHPLSGVLAALNAASGEGIVVFGCDTPFVPPTLLARLAGTGGGPGERAVKATGTGPDRPVAVSQGGRIHPLIAAWPAGAAGRIRRALDASESMTAVMADLGPELISEEELGRYGDPERICFNINTPDDLAAAEAMLA